MTNLIRSILCLALLSVTAEGIASQNGLQTREVALEAAWSRELETKKTPIQRVIALLTQMKAELDKEASDEAAMYDKMVCWCETNEKQKTKAISDAEALDKELTAEIGSRAAKFGEQATEVVRLKKQIAADSASLKKSTAIREREAAEFSQTEKDLTQSITNVKNAIEVLSKHHSGASFAQLDAPVMSSMRAVLRDLAFKHELLTVESSEQHGTALLALGAKSEGTTAAGDSLLSALDARGAAAAESLPLEIAQKVLSRSAKDVPVAGGFLQSGAAPTSGSYSSQSGPIFGIMKAMHEDFEKNLSQEQRDEMKAAKDFKAMSAAKSSQIAVGKEKLDEIEGEHADNQKGLSDAKEELQMTRDQRSKDVEFLRNLKITCMGLDKQWEQRSKTRSTETKAVSEAISVLTDDDNMDHLRNTPTTLLQLVSNSDSEEGAEAQLLRKRAATALRTAAKAPAFDDLLDAWQSRSGSLVGARSQLSTLAVSVSLDSFKKLKEVMDKMTADLKAENQDEVEFKAHCEAEFDITEKETFKKTDIKGDLEANIEKLSKLMETVSGEIAAAQAQSADAEVAIKKASQVREGENSEFQKVVADQRATQAILTKALDKLQEFYKKALFIQKSKQEPPVKFNDYKKNAGASPVIGLIQQIVEDSVALEKEAVAGESEAQANYQTFVKDSNDLIAKLTESISQKTKARASAKMDSEQDKSDLDSTVGELQALAEYEGDLHRDCDFVLKNFNIRQKARLDEMDAIQQAKAILSGSA